MIVQLGRVYRLRDSDLEFVHVLLDLALLVADITCECSVNNRKEAKEKRLRLTSMLLGAVTSEATDDLVLLTSHTVTSALGVVLCLGSILLGVPGSAFLGTFVLHVGGTKGVAELLQVSMSKPSQG